MGCVLRGGRKLNRFHRLKPTKTGLILDPCVGPGEWWKEQKGVHVIKCDKIATCSNLVISTMIALPFAEGTFDEIWCDPPHLIRNDLSHWNKSYLRYGNWRNRREWEHALRGMNTEFRRVLRDTGLLYMKIISGPDRRVTKEADLSLMTNFCIEDKEVWPSGAGWSNNVSILAKMSPL